MCDGVATPPHRFPAYSLSLSRDYLSTKNCDLDFVEEAGHKIGVVGEVGAQDFDRDVPLDGVVEPFIDRAHAALAELAEQSIGAKPGLGHRS